MSPDFMPQTAVFEIKNICKTYPGVTANDDVSFSISPASIHALLGENGAGKSTLVKIMYGLVAPSSGCMSFEGKPFAPHKPQDARAAGIGMVFQHFSLFDALSVAENIAVGMENPPHRTTLKQEIRRISSHYGLPLDPDAIVGDLSAGERQRVEIIRCLLLHPKLLIMDEPTSVLTPLEVETLFKTLRILRDQGVSILYISHKLEEIRTLCNEATIMRRGAVVEECDPRQRSARALAEAMVGTKIPDPKPRNSTPGQTRLVLENASTHTDHVFGTNLKHLNLTVRAHEILGIAGVAGNGQDELMELLSGELPMENGSMSFDGRAIGHLGARQRRKLGLISAPEERLGHAAVPIMTLSQNALLTAEDRVHLSRKKWINWPKTNAFAQNVIEVFDVRTPGVDTQARALSGGNLQKFVIGREILQNPGVFVLNQPTWGVDAAAAGFIRQRLRLLADEGAAIVLISQDLDEIFELADSIAVLSGGVLSPIHPSGALDLQSIGELMGNAA